MCNKTSYFKSSSLKLETSYENDESGVSNLIYLENNEYIPPVEEDHPISFEDFKKIIRQRVIDFTHNSFDNVIVLAGAGASIVIGDNGKPDEAYGKTVEMIAKKINCELKLDENLYNLQELADKSKYTIKVEIDGEYNTEFNLEDFLSNVLTYENFIDGTPEEIEKFKESKDKILQLIKENTTYDFKSDIMNHGRFLKVLSKKIKKPNKLNIITTNYDTLFEDAGEQLNFTFIDGFTFSSTPTFDSDMFEWNLIKDIPNVKTKELEYKSNVVNLLKIHGSLTWERSRSEKNIIRKPKQTVNNPIMIFPSSNKYAQSYEEPYFELFTKFQELLKRQNTLLITVGFSFADNHISKMITGAIKNNPGLGVLICDHNIDQNHTNWMDIENLKDSHFRVALLKATLNDDLIYYLGESL
ncbi:SIR2 family protein [Enterococcus faecalis]|uniref:SIR2 family protein n=1 Tax=Enterococcus faecalis TaxID=1351 RepID=UPI00035FD96F|nr:SIR2 family protein [Enterococcus faecalis]EPI27199.1 hypothetical protein D350_02896 [Enterococcus faecalis VC1B-1]